MEQIAPALDASLEVEGYDESQADSGLGDYPLDQVFVRSELRTVGDVVRRIQAGRYELHPDFQRDFVWPAEKQSRLIESCLMRIPLPVFYVAEAPDGRIIVVDGLQRLTTFSMFLEGRFKLSFSESEENAEKHSALNGKRFRDLALNLQERLEDTQLTLYILDSKAPERARLDIFERVNSGETLTRQQMRNCLYNGPATVWLRNAASSDAFTSATGRSLDSKKMRDREAINRFCGFTLLGAKEYRGDMDGFLARTLEQMNCMTHADLAHLRERFERSMTTNEALFGQHAFRKSLAAPDYASRSVLNIALFDICSVLLSGLRPGDVEQYRAAIRTALKRLLAREDFVKAITYSTNSTRAIVSRFSLMQDELGSVLA